MKSIILLSFFCLIFSIIPFAETKAVVAVKSDRNENVIVGKKEKRFARFIPFNKTIKAVKALRQIKKAHKASKKKGKVDRIWDVKIFRYSTLLVLGIAIMEFIFWIVGINFSIFSLILGIIGLLGMLVGAIIYMFKGDVYFW